MSTLNYDFNSSHRSDFDIKILLIYTWPPYEEKKLYVPHCVGKDSQTMLSKVNLFNSSCMAGKLTQLLFMISIYNPFPHPHPEKKSTFAEKPSALH